MAFYDPRLHKGLQMMPNRDSLQIQFLGYFFHAKRSAIEQAQYLRSGWAA
jgi:hypothetical protein